MIISKAQRRFRYSLAAFFLADAILSLRFHMVLQGHVRNGVIVLDDPIPLAEGTAVSVAIPPPVLATLPSQAETSIWDVFAAITGELDPKSIERLPVDGAERHDDYLRGTAERRQ
jgi:hypothetical protein